MKRCHCISTTTTMYGLLMVMSYLLRQPIETSDSGSPGSREMDRSLKTFHAGTRSGTTQAQCGSRIHSGSNAMRAAEAHLRKAKHIRSKSDSGSPRQLNRYGPVHTSGFHFLGCAPASRIALLQE